MAVSILLAIVLQRVDLLGISGIVFTINLFIYTKSKNKYDTQLNTLYSIGGLVLTADRIADTDKFSYESTFQDLKSKATIFKKISRIVSMMKSRKDASLSGELSSIIYDYIVGVTLWDFIKYGQTLMGRWGKELSFDRLDRDTLYRSAEI